MKILLVGEFSGVHNNLKKGLLELGHDVKLAADGDGFKQIGYDYRIAPYKGNILGKFKNIFYLIRNIKKFIGYDVVQFISPFSLPYYYSFVFLTFLIFRFNGKSVYYACGTDPAFLGAKDRFRYFPFDDPDSKEYPKYNVLYMHHYRLFIRSVNVIIPAMYMYAVSYFNNSKLSKVVLLPGSGRYGGSLSVKKNQIRILFGITRKGFKGAKYIIAALNRVQEIYGHKVKVSIVEKITYKEYLKCLDNCDVLIDQCKSYDYGMNAILGLENGIIVLSGLEKEAIEYSRYEDCPVVNIIPDENKILEELIRLCEMNFHALTCLREKSLNYAIRNHNPSIIADTFEQIYSANEKS